MPPTDEPIVGATCKVGPMWQRPKRQDKGWILPSGCWNETLWGIESGGAHRVEQRYEGSAIVICSSGSGGPLQPFGEKLPQWTLAPGEHCRLITAAGKPLISVAVTWHSGHAITGTITEHTLHIEDHWATISQTELWSGDARRLPSPLARIFGSAMAAACRKAQCLDCHLPHYAAIPSRCSNWKAEIIP